MAVPDRRISRSLAHDHSETKPLFRTRRDIRHASDIRSTSRDPGRTVSLYLQESDSNRISVDVHGRLGTRGCGSFCDKVVDRARANGTPLISIPSQPMLDYDAHLHAFQVDLTERASLERINQAKEHWGAYVQGIQESELLINKQTILLSAWRAEDRALRSSRARPVVCSDCGARHLEHFYTARVGGDTLCACCFQRRVECGVAREAER